jgi:DNA primase
MDDETPEMEKLTQQMRAAMAAWVAEPGNDLLKQQYRDLQRRYQRLFLDYKRNQRNGVAG